MTSRLSSFTSDAFFADDCTIWRSGRNLPSIIFHLQKDLDTISEWCLKWGFIINTSKTIGIAFTNQKINTNTIILKINKNLIKFSNKSILLGINFVSHLTWSTHVYYLVDQSNKGLNLMRCLSGTSWGSSRKVMLTLYKSLILSKLDYCSFLYMNAAASILRKIDTIQYKALLLSVGGMRGTALNVLLGDCGELPMKHRR